LTMRPLLCEVCGTEIKELYCTENICRDCCNAGKCPCESWCKSKRIERRVHKWEKRAKAQAKNARDS